MKTFKETFNKFPVVLPVIHTESRDQALRNAEIARQNACQGVFLINHNIPSSTLLEIQQAVFETFPDWWIGVNCLDLAPWEVFDQLTAEVAGVWVDNAYINEHLEPQATAESIATARLKSGWRGLYFGGVAFKYQRYVADLERAATLATNYVDVVTTSGSGTGQAAHVQKITRMKHALGPFPLAIASGITPENVPHYLGLSDCFLVATGISQSWTELDSKRLTRLMAQVQWEKP